MSVVCGECGSPMVLRQSRYGPFWGCTKWPECDGKHGAHEDGRPLGIPANKATKQKRIEAHEWFDSLWDDGPMKRKEAYKWMQHSMGMTPDEAHIGRFTIEQCDKLISLVQRYRNLKGGVQ